MKMDIKKGQALIIVCLAIVFLVILAAPLFNIVLNERSMLERARFEKEAFYLAEGALEDTINQFITDVANFQVPVNTSRYPASGTHNTAYAASAAFPSGAQASSYVEEAPTDPSTINEMGTIIKVKNYIVTSICRHPANTNITVTLKRAIILRKIATFQHAIFYNDVLELLPGAPMTFKGRIHGNNDIYIASNGSTLTIDSDYLRSAGNIYNKRKDKIGSDNGTVNIKVAGSTNTFQNMHTDPILDCDNPDWDLQSQTCWNGTVQSSVHGVTKLAAPVIGSLKPNNAHYVDNAGLKIIGTTITRGSVTLSEGGAGHGRMPVGTIKITSTLTDAREGEVITTTNIDLKKLAGYDADGVRRYDNNLPSNGLVYASSSNSDTPAPATAIRLINGSTIYSGDTYAGVDPITGNPVTSDSGGLTVVTNNPVYIQGNYNTDGKPVTDGTSGKQTAVICDSVNILSNSWDDSRSGQSLSNRIAGDTRVNTAFIAGVDITTLGHYNGGLENYPRLLENWSNKTLYIKGCFIELWNAQAAMGNWKDTGNYYNAPIRNWSYDPSFASGDNLPPLTPYAIEAQRSTWWKE